jgi:dihydroorotate dehydrogenase (NAD+) catalytic subunit
MAQQLTKFLYDPDLSFYDNLKQGPWVSDDEPAFRNVGEPQVNFFDSKVYSPFGIAAGPLPMAHFVKAAFDKGFDIITFKTVRTREFPCFPHPNVYPLAIDQLDPMLKTPVQTRPDYRFPLTIANSFGIPSFDPSVWQEEIRKSFAHTGKGQALLVAFQGTDPNKGHEAYVYDHVKGVQLLYETGARVVEINFSCPNTDSPKLLCFDPETCREIIVAVREKVGDVKLLVKVAYFTTDTQLREFVQTVGPYVDGITAINTEPVKVINAEGKPAFPDSLARVRPGVSGHAIKHLAVDMVRRLAAARDELGLDYKIIGVGGVQSAEDFHEHRAAGADFVMSLTGAMWNPDLAAEIKASMVQ